MDFYICVMLVNLYDGMRNISWVLRFVKLHRTITVRQCHVLIKELRWQGLCMQPVLYFRCRIKCIYPDTILAYHRKIKRDIIANTHRIHDALRINRPCFYYPSSVIRSMSFARQFYLYTCFRCLPRPHLPFTS